MPQPELPPAFELHTVSDNVNPVDAARQLATKSIHDGAVFWQDRQDRFAAAFILEPETGKEQVEEVKSVFTLALTIALGASIPPTIPVQISPFSVLVVDGYELAEVKIETSDSVDPQWIIVAVEFANNDPDAENALARIAGESEPSDRILMTLCRQLLSWVYRWQEEGISPIEERLRALKFDRDALEAKQH